MYPFDQVRREFPKGLQGLDEGLRKAFKGLPDGLLKGFGQLCKFMQLCFPDLHESRKEAGPQTLDFWIFGNSKLWFLDFWSFLIF